MQFGENIQIPIIRKYTKLIDTVIQCIIYIWNDYETTLSFDILIEIYNPFETSLHKNQLVKA